MMPVLLLWCLVAPSLPGADADAVLIAGRLRRRVARIVGKIAFAGILFWLACSITGVLTVVFASVAHQPRVAAMGPIMAFSGGLAAAFWTMGTCFLETSWLKTLGLPADWRGPWLAGDLAEHMGLKRRTIHVTIPTSPRSRPAMRPRQVSQQRTHKQSASVPPEAPSAGSRADALGSMITPLDRWQSDDSSPTEIIDLRALGEDWQEAPCPVDTPPGAWLPNGRPNVVRRGAA